MSYFVTGGTGFIGRFLIEKLLQREGTIHLLMREASAYKLGDLHQRFPGSEERIVAVYGDLTKPKLGLSDESVAALKGNIDHFFHLAAIYDMKADAESQQRANVDGTRNAVQCAEVLQAGCFEHVS